MTRYTEAKINYKMAPNWPQNRSPGEFGTALRNILKMLRNAVPNSPGNRFEGQLEAIFRFILASVCMVMVCVSAPSSATLGYRDFSECSAKWR